MITVKSLGLADANQVIQAGIARATEIGSPSTIAVVDVGGTVVAQARMDGASLSSVALAYNKAYTSLSTRLATSTITKFRIARELSTKCTLFRTRHDSRSEFPENRQLRRLYIEPLVERGDVNEQ